MKSVLGIKTCGRKGKEAGLAEGKSSCNAGPTAAASANAAQNSAAKTELQSCPHEPRWSDLYTHTSISHWMWVALERGMVLGKTAICN